MVAFIALLQYLNNRRQRLINEEKFKLDLFDKRFKVFDVTRELFFNIMQSGGECDRQVLREFSLKTIDATFLFDKAISEYIDNASRKAIRLDGMYRQCRGRPIGTKGNEFLKEHNQFKDC